MPKTAPPHSTSATNLLFGLCAFLLCFAPLLRGGRTYDALLVLEVGGTVLLALALWQGKNLFRATPRGLGVWLSACWAGTLLYLIPLPWEIWQELPGRERFAAVYASLMEQGIAPDYLALSIIPYRTLSALLSLIPPTAILLATLLLPKHQVVRLLYLFLGMATLQAALGLIQYGSQSDWAFWWGIPVNPNATGTYVNRDHFSGMLEMALPLALALLAYHFHIPHDPRDDEAEGHGRPFHFNNTLVFLVVSLLLIVGIIFSRSRTGIALMILALPLCALVFARHLGGRLVLGMSGVIVALSLGIATSIGLIPVLNRFAVDPATDLRWEIFAVAWEATKQHLPVGTGPGTFQAVFATYQPATIPNFINHAHNDYLEMLLEMGLIGSVLTLWGMGLYFRQWIIKQRMSWDHFHFLRTGAGLGLLLLLMHSFLDFQLHVAANNILASFLLGIFMHRSGQKGNPT